MDNVERSGQKGFLFRILLILSFLWLSVYKYTRSSSRLERFGSRLDKRLCVLLSSFI
ncbi:hypothetical protein BDW66DRAFT_129204 [Aspergillus desertorum]